ncbi:MAG: hypothetical protein WCD80_13925 [Desulfobaccales bacterium]
MNDHHGYVDKDDHLQAIMTESPKPKKVAVSPLGWSIKGRLVWAAVASALLWLSVAWAIGRLP